MPFGAYSCRMTWNLKFRRAYVGKALSTSLQNCSQSQRLAEKLAAKWASKSSFDFAFVAIKWKNLKGVE